MLYLKNSLVNLTIILFSLFFLSISLAENTDFIFPKKKIITIKNVEKKKIKIEKKNIKKTTKLPKKKPREKKILDEKDVKKNR